MMTDGTALLDSSHFESIEAAAARLDVDPGVGLSEKEARRRASRFGRNVIAARKRPGTFQLLARQFRSVLIWLLVVAAAISGIALGEWIDAGVILAIVVLNATIGLVQESRAEGALAELEGLAAPEASVVRGGVERRVRAADLVPGDRVLLEPGDRVPADARVIESVHLEASEAALTGESFPARKQREPVPLDSSIGDRRSMVFAGTDVVAGRGAVLVTTIGGGTEMGKIAALLEEDEPPTPLETELDRAGRVIAALAVVAAVATMALGWLRDQPLEAIFLLGVALAVAAIPEGLPAVVTVTLARGVQAMARRNAIVRRLPAVEALGAATVICTDKTGTLTMNEISLHEVAFDDAVIGRSDLDRDEDRVRRLRLVALLCNDARITASGPAGDPTEIALMHGLDPRGDDTEPLRLLHPRIDEVSFDSNRKRMTTLHSDGDRYLLAMKGAPEVVVGRCTAILGADGPRPLTGNDREAILRTSAALAEQGRRTLATAYRELTAPPEHLGDAETELVFIGVTALSDELRPEAESAVNRARQAGVRVVMVTGDHEATARTIAAELGLTGGVMGGAELRATAVEALDVAGNAVFARVDPADKVKIIDAWRRRGDIVAMTGDGINDAPALVSADIGIAMGSGTDVAREASDVVLTDDNFASIVAAVEEGRTIFRNLRNVLHFLLSANVSEIFVVLGASLLLGASGVPILAVQLLWVNLITDGLPALALGADPPGDDVMTSPPDRSRSLLGGRTQVRLAFQAAVLALGVLGVFGAGVMADLPWEYVRTLGFTTLVVTQLVHAWNVRSGDEPPWRYRGKRNHLLVWAAAGSFLLQLLVLYTAIGNDLFGVVPIDLVHWPIVVAGALCPFLLIGATKHLVSGSAPLRRR
jgi:P-type Ca2+ transporter type 2C